MTTDTYDTGYAKSRERFEHDTAEHEMTVLRDDGLYRHVRFQRPGSPFYWFDLVTWPGRLVVCGDCGDYMFSRTCDMFEFFADGSAGRRSTINPHYWGEKLQGARPGREGAKSYSEDALRSHVIGWFEDMTGPIDPEAFAGEDTWREFERTGMPVESWEIGGDYFTSADLTTWQRFELSRALDDEVLSGYDDHDPSYEQGARALLAAFEFPSRDALPYNAPRGLTISDSWEWDLRDYDHAFLWCCWAIVRGIEQYRAARPADQPAVAA